MYVLDYYGCKIKCWECDKHIQQGSEYLMLEDEYYHLACVESMTVKELLNSRQDIKIYID